MELTDRKKQILKIVVDGYVATAEPVSDSTVIALQGVPGSPEFKANAEWMDFLASYDTAAMAEEAAACLPEKYWSHRVTHGERGSQAAMIELL